MKTNLHRHRQYLSKVFDSAKEMATNCFTFFYQLTRFSNQDMGPV